MPPASADASGVDDGSSSAEGTATTEGSATDAAAAHDTGEGGSSEAGDTGDAPAKGQKSGSGPLIAILSIVIFLVLIAFLWHINPFPSVRDSIAGLFSSSEEVIPPMDTELTDDAATHVDETAATPMRSWDYFLQVSSWDDLAKADLEAERYRAQGLDVVVESEYIPRKHRTYYRVRLGPYDSPQQATEAKANYASVLPADAFLDSTRLAVDEVEEDLPAESTATAPAPRHRADPLPTQRSGSEFDVINEPLNGYAVKVSSFKELPIARSEARKLVGLGYPAFLTKKRIGSTSWYRVLVGPFSDKRDADRYMELLNVTYGNEAYTVNLASY